MANVKFLSGVLQVDNNNMQDGDAEINFQPHGVAGDAVGNQLTEAGSGAGKRYSTNPTVLLALTTAANVNVQGAPNFNIRYSGLTTDQVQVIWDATDLDIVNISYLVVGMTP